MADEIAPTTGAMEAAPETQAPAPEAGAGTAPATQTVEPKAPASAAPTVEVEGEAVNVETPAAPERPKFTDLYRDPDFKRQADGHFGERLRQERQAARDAARDELIREQQHQAAQQDEARFQQEWDREAQRRQQEQARVDQIAEQGDPNLELEGIIKEAKARRAQWQQRWDAAMGARQQARQGAERESAGISLERAAWHGAMDEIFRSLPQDVQTQLGGKTYDGTPQQILVKQMQDYLGVMRTAWQADLDQRVEAEVQKRMAKAHLAEPGVVVGASTGNGAAGDGLDFKALEDAEKALRDGRITVAQLKQVKARGVKYRRDW